ncbi:MAG: flavin reductase [Bacteroidota bacterium]
MEKFFRRYFFNSLSGFKSVNLVGTKSAAGQTNLGVFSQIFHIGANPPLMGMIVRPHTVERHTLENILETKFYTFNHIHADFYKAAHQASASYPRERSEFEAVGLTEAYSENEKFIAPYVGESWVQIGLELAERHDLSINGTIFLIGHVREVRVAETIISADGYLDLEEAQSVTCSSLDNYHTTQRLARLSYPKPDQELKEVEVKK